jgi:16S rRNA (cytosine967-C5)-methyltransferase
MAALSPARKAAFQILLAVERGQGHSDDLLRSQAVSALSAPDRNLTTTLVLGVLRWQLYLDQRLQAHLKHPNAKLDAEVLIALRLGAFQLLHLDRIPARAAIDQSVELTKQSGHRFASGMVNAVLRKLAGSVGQGFSPDDKMTGETGALAPGACSLALAAHPSWMVERWTRFFGEETTCAISRHGQSQPALAIRLDHPETEEELAHAGIALAPGELLTAARIVVSGNVAATGAFHEGRVRIQDEGSQLVAEIAGKGGAILDCCAAPGGKTLVLAERNPQARIVACEASPQRLEALRQRLAPLGDRIECRLADASALGQDSAYNLVLADVPCSGTGTLGRNPEIRHRLSLDDIARQAERQRAILSAALRAVRPGGRVVYSTCSLEPEENEQVVAAALNQNAKIHVIPLQSRIEQMRSEGVLTASGAEALLRCVTPEGYLRLFPGVCGTDGFFIAVLGLLAQNDR